MKEYYFYFFKDGRQTLRPIYADSVAKAEFWAKLLCFSGKYDIYIKA